MWHVGVGIGTLVIWPIVGYSVTGTHLDIKENNQWIFVVLYNNNNNNNNNDNNNNNNKDFI